MMTEFAREMRLLQLDPITLSTEHRDGIQFPKVPLFTFNAKASAFLTFPTLDPQTASIRKLLPKYFQGGNMASD